MGTCFGCFSKNNIRKPARRRKIFKFGKSQEVPQDEEFLELEQRPEEEAGTPTYGDDGASENIKPPKPSYKRQHFGWLKNENEIFSGALNHLKNMKSPVDSIMPLLNRKSSYADTCSNAGSQKWDQLSTGATPGSSVDLEWENEIGFHSSSNFGASEEPQWTVLTENTNNTNNSYRSSPLSNSNGLEWDGDFTSVDVSEIITETQRLTSELDDNILQDSTNNVVRDRENNY